MNCHCGKRWLDDASWCVVRVACARFRPFWPLCPWPHWVDGQKGREILGQQKPDKVGWSRVKSDKTTSISFTELEHQRRLAWMSGSRKIPPQVADLPPVNTEIHQISAHFTGLSCWFTAACNQSSEIFFTRGRIGNGTEYDGGDGRGNRRASTGYSWIIGSISTSIFFSCGCTSVLLVASVPRTIAAQKKYNVS